MSPVVTYVGPKDAADPTTRYRLPVPGEADVVLPRGQAVEVTEKQAKALKADKAHNFKAGEKAPPEDGTPWPGYDDLNADEVVEQIGDPIQVPTKAAAKNIVEYEKNHQKRKTVIEAAEAQVEAYSVTDETG